MVIKVIKPKPKPKLTCHGCKAVLEFEFDDLTPGYYEHDYTETGPKGVGIVCPECRSDNHWPKAPDALVELIWKKKGKGLDQ